MIAVLVVLSSLVYLAIGILVTRRVYIYFNDNYERRVSSGGYDYPPTMTNPYPPTMTNPFVLLLTLLFWPLAIVLAGGAFVAIGLAKLVMRETPFQREQRLAKEEKNRALRCAKEAKRCGLPLTEEDERLLRTNGDY